VGPVPGGLTAFPASPPQPSAAVCPSAVLCSDSGLLGTPLCLRVHGGVFRFNLSQVPFRRSLCRSASRVFQNAGRLRSPFFWQIRPAPRPGYSVLRGARVLSGTSSLKDSPPNHALVKVILLTRRLFYATLYGQPPNLTLPISSFLESDLPLHRFGRGRGPRLLESF